MRKPIPILLFACSIAALLCSVSLAQEYRLRIRVNFSEDGAEVLAVTEGGPGSRLYAATDAANSSASLEPGDVIRAIDGAGFDNQQQYQALLADGARDDGFVRLTIRDKRTGNDSDWYVKPKKVQSAPPATFQQATAVHVILVGDTDDPRLGEHVETTLFRLKPEFELTPRLAEITEITGARVTPANILNTIDQLPVAPTEALLYYHVGHGSYAPAIADGDPSGGHFFSIGNGRGDLLRKDVLKHLRDKGAQLTVLISDTCNTRAEVDIPSVQYLAPQVQTNRVLGNLLLDHHGVVDISGSSRDQYAWFSRGVGGWFSDRFLLTARQSYPEDQFVTWEMFLNQLTTATSEFYKAKRQTILDSVQGARPTILHNLEAQDDQRPQVFTSSVAAN